MTYEVASVCIFAGCQSKLYSRETPVADLSICRGSFLCRVSIFLVSDAGRQKCYTLSDVDRICHRLDVTSARTFALQDDHDKH